MRGNLPESVFAVLGVAAILGAVAAAGAGGFVTAALLVWPTAAFLSAPLNSLGAQHATLPGELDQRRRTEFRRFGSRPAKVTAAGLFAVVVASLLLAPAGQRVVSANPVTPARGHHPSPAVHSSSPASPTSSTSSGPTSAPTSSAPASAASSSSP